MVITKVLYFSFVAKSVFGFRFLCRAPQVGTHRKIGSTSSARSVRQSDPLRTCTSPQNVRLNLPFYAANACNIIRVAAYILTINFFFKSLPLLLEDTRRPFVPMIDVLHYFCSSSTCSASSIYPAQPTSFTLRPFTRPPA